MRWRPLPWPLTCGPPPWSRWGPPPWSSSLRRRSMGSKSSATAKSQIVPIIFSLLCFACSIERTVSTSRTFLGSPVSVKRSGKLSLIHDNILSMIKSHCCHTFTFTLLANFTFTNYPSLASTLDYKGSLATSHCQSVNNSYSYAIGTS